MSSVGLQPDQQVQSRPAGPLPVSVLRACAFGFLIVLLSLALYYPARTHGFVNYDDNVYVTDNEHVKNGLTWDTVCWAFVTYEAGNWHPVTWLSHALDFELYDMEPGRHHETNLLLHAANVALLFFVLLRATGYAGRSFMVAALFAVHPINVEPVVWIAERKTVLSMLFFLLSLGAYRWYAAKPKVTRYGVVALLFALGLMAKPQVITLPFVLLLWDYWPLDRTTLALRSSLLARRQNGACETSGKKRIANSEQPDLAIPARSFSWLLWEKLPLFAIAAASAAITMKAQRAGGSVLSLGDVPLSLRWSNAILAYVKYIQKAFWPTKLAPMYPHPGASLPAWQVYGALLLLLVITMLVFEKRRHRYLLVGWFWFLGTLVPMIGLVQVGRQAMADRYAYLPLLGIFIMVCWGVADLLKGKRAAAVLLPIAGVVVVLTLSVMARRQIGYWADNQILWTHTIEVTPPNYVAQDNLGGTLLHRKRPEEAIVHFREAAAIHPVDPISRFNIAFYEQQRGNLPQAIEDYKRAIVLTTSTGLKIKAYENLGAAYRDLGESDQARQSSDEARKLKGP